MSLPSAASALLSPSASTLVSAFAAVVLSVLEEPHPVKDDAAIHPASPKAAARLMVALVKMFFLIVFCPPFGSLKIINSTCFSFYLHMYTKLFNKLFQM